jgi:DNA-binding transcriptional regulator YhcF (GntR family)
MTTAERAVRSPALYQQLADTLARRIDRGEFATGQVLPSETVLMGQNGLSRPTVRSAIAELRKRGLVETRQGYGTFVSPTPSAADERFSPQDSPAGSADLGATAAAAVHRLRKAITEDGPEPTLRTRAIRPVAEAFADLLECAAASQECGEPRFRMLAADIRHATDAAYGACGREGPALPGRTTG